VLIEVNGGGAEPGPILPSGPPSPRLELLQVFTYHVLREVAVRRGQIGCRARGEIAYRGSRTAKRVALWYWNASAHAMGWLMPRQGMRGRFAC
jgi:hypothetical protein